MHDVLSFPDQRRRRRRKQIDFRSKFRGIKTSPDRGKDGAEFELAGKRKTADVLAAYTPTSSLQLPTEFLQRAPSGTRQLWDEEYEASIGNITIRLPSSHSKLIASLKVKGTSSNCGQIVNIELLTAAAPCFPTYPTPLLPILALARSPSLLSIVYAFRIQGQTAAQPRSFGRQGGGQRVGRRSQSCNTALKVCLALNLGWREVIAVI